MRERFGVLMEKPPQRRGGPFARSRELWSKIDTRADAWLADVCEERMVKIDSVALSDDTVVRGLRVDFADRRPEE